MEKESHIYPWPQRLTLPMRVTTSDDVAAAPRMFRAALRQLLSGHVMPTSEKSVILILMSSMSALLRSSSAKMLII